MKTRNGIFLIWVFIVSSFAIGFRSFDVGTDTAQYIRHFNTSIETNHIVDNFEIGFSLLMYVAGKISNDYRVFFTLVALIISITYIYLFSKIFFDNKDRKYLNYTDIAMICFLMFISSWYFAFTTNGLRQGIALPILYLSLYYFVFEKKKIKSIVYFSLSLIFHVSGLLFTPFILLLNKKRLYIWFLWLLLLIGYFLGTNEVLVKMISDYMGLPLYKVIKYYAVVRGENPESSLYHGFDLRFVLYTAFWPIIGELSIILRKKNMVDDLFVLKNIIKIYITMNLPYFLFGFGGFSNRYAAMSWFLVPILQFGILKHSNLKLIGAYMWLCLALCAFLNYIFLKLSYVG